MNDYCALDSPSSPSKIWLCYAGGSGYGGYGGYGGYRRRVRVFEIDTNAARISTYKRVEPGTKNEQGEDLSNKRVDEQIVIEGGKVVAP